MQINHLHLENFRKYASEDFHFHPQFNLIVGENGAGKTSILEALAVAIGSWLLGIRGYDSRHIWKRDIRREAIFEGKRYSFKEHYPVVVKVESGVVAGKELAWSRELSNQKTAYKNANSIKELAQILADKIGLKDVSVILPLISYYGANRLWDIPRDMDPENVQLRSPQDYSESRMDKQTKKAEEEAAKEDELLTDRFVGYRFSVDSRTDLSFLLKWMTNERRIEIDEDDKSPYIRAVVKAIRGCLPPDVKNVKYSIRQKTLMFHYEDGRILPLSDLSDGYRNIVALVGDIASKAALLNPSLMGEAIVKTPGVVLIDELDQHLHPRWQRTIIEKLRKTFPMIQFICTTHSPFLIQSLRSGEELIVLDRQAIAQLANSGVEKIAKGVMGISHPDVSERYLSQKNCAKEYLETLEVAAKSPREELEEFKNKLAEGLEKAENPALQAFLEMKRIAKLGE